MPSSWEPLGTVSPRGLAEARLLLHQASQLVAAVGRGLVAARPDDGHTSLEWLGDARTLAGQSVAGSKPWRVALRADALALAVLGPTDPADLSLPGHTRREAFAWLRGVAKSLGATAEALRPEEPYAMPPSPVGDGAPFWLPGDGSLSELARWFANADGLLRAVADTWPGSAPVRVWPHHFDIGSVLPLGAGTGEGAPSIGVGLSPGDEDIGEPYWYVTPWPPPGGALPELRVGRWHTAGWTGAVLTGSDLVVTGSGPAQAAVAARFLTEAVEVLRSWPAARRS